MSAKIAEEGQFQYFYCNLHSISCLISGKTHKKCKTLKSNEYLFKCHVWDNGVTCGTLYKFQSIKHTLDFFNSFVTISMLLKISRTSFYDTSYNLYIIHVITKINNWMKNYVI